MKNGLRPWIVGQPEKKAALIVASASLVLVALAFIWPWVGNKSEPTPPIEVAAQDVPAPITPARVVKPAKPAEPASRPSTVERSPVPTKETPPVSKPKPEPSPMPEPRNRASIPSGYYVQLGAFKDTKRADALAGRLSGKWKTHVVERPNQLHAVWIGPYASSKEAEQEKVRIAKAEKISGFIIKH